MNEDDTRFPHWSNDLSEVVDLDDSELATTTGGEKWYKNPNTYLTAAEIAAAVAE